MQNNSMFERIYTLFDIKKPQGFDDTIMASCAFDLPLVLKTYYQTLGQHPTLNHSQDHLLAPNELFVSPNQDFLVFYIENQEVCTWGINITDLTLENPPVFISHDKITWQKAYDTLSDFLYMMANLQAVFGLPYTPEEFYDINEQQKAVIKQHFKKRTDCQLWLGIEFFGNHDNEVIALIKNDGYDDLIYASSDKTAFDRLDEFFGRLFDDI